jgi:hypothetical protein
MEKDKEGEECTERLQISILITTRRVLIASGLLGISVICVLSLSITGEIPEEIRVLTGQYLGYVIKAAV